MSHGRRSRRFGPNTQNNLGGALQILSAREQDTVRLHNAITAYGAALQVRTRKAAPLDWAITQNNLGAVLRILGEREKNTAMLHDAITACEAALQVYTRKDMPMDWAGTMNNLGLALRWLGTQSQDLSCFDRAKSAFSLYLEERTFDNVPFHWATTQWNLADLALARFALAQDAALLTKARDYANAARDVFVDGLEHQTQRCDELLQKITDAENQ
jgi:tetratricopeptide (TPR) repeat protein